MKEEYLHFFEGVDPAPSESHRSDDGALVVGAAYPRREPEKGQQLSDNPEGLVVRFRLWPADDVGAEGVRPAVGGDYASTPPAVPVFADLHGPEWWRGAD